MSALHLLDDGLSTDRSTFLRESMADALYDPDPGVTAVALGTLFGWRAERGRPHYHPTRLAVEILEREFADLDSVEFLKATSPRQPLVIEWSSPIEATCVAAPRKALMYLGGALSPEQLLSMALSDGGSGGRAMRRWAIESLVFHYGHGFISSAGVRAQLDKACESKDGDTRALAKAGTALLPASREMREADAPAGEQPR